MRDDIQAAIRLGKFTIDDFAHYFPDSKWLKKQPTRTGDTFKDMHTGWLRLAESQISSTTLSEYKRTLARYFSIWDERAISSLGFDEIAEHVGGLGIKTPKTFNNIMTPLRRTFDYARATKKILEDPTELIDSRRVQKAMPDPLALDEIEAVLAHIRERHDEQWWNYFEVAFFVGPRPSEHIALQWSRMDFRRRALRVDSARVRATDKGTKTHVVRDIDLAQRAYDALLRQKKHTFMNTESGYIFHNPNSGTRFMNTDPPLEIWHSTLRKLGIRDRDARQTRHSFATMCLHAGMNPAYVAGQMGNSVKMFFEVYSKWIQGEANDRERAKLDALLSQAPMKKAL